MLKVPKMYKYPTVSFGSLLTLQPETPSLFPAVGASTVRQFTRGVIPMSRRTEEEWRFGPGDRHPQDDAG